MINKRGLSGVVSTVLLVGLTVAIVAIVWVVVQNLAKGEIDKSESCFGIYDKVKIDSRYTCYNDTAKTLTLYLEILDVEPERVLVSVSSDAGAKSFYIGEEEIDTDPAVTGYGEEVGVCSGSVDCESLSPSRCNEADTYGGLCYYDNDPLLVGCYSSSLCSQIEPEECMAAEAANLGCKWGSVATLPERNSGKAYTIDLISLGLQGAPDYVKIAPIIKGNQCETADDYEDIDLCSSLV